MQAILGIIAAAIILVLGCFALGLMGQLCILVLDTIARGFGVDNPVLGWIFVGVVFGAIAGLRYGLRRAGAPLSTARTALMVAIPVILLGSIGAARSSPPSRFQHESAGATPFQPIADDREAMTISVDAMNLRSKPTTHSAVVATLHANSVLTLLETAGEWSHVAERSSPQRYTGWLKSKYLHRISNAGNTADAVNSAGDETAQPKADAVPNTLDGAPAVSAESAVSTVKVATDTVGSSKSCYQAEGISCTIVPEEEQQPIEEAFTASLEAINQRDIARAQASVSRANQLLAPWLHRSPSDPWVARTSRHLNTVSGDIPTVCMSARKHGEQLPGC